MPVNKPVSLAAFDNPGNHGSHLPKSALLYPNQPGAVPLVYPAQAAQHVPLNCGSNPLTGAAANLLAIAARLQQNSTIGLNGLFPVLVQEIILFEQQAQRLDYHLETIKIASYTLCACLDEIMSEALLTQGQTLAEQEYLLQNFHHETWAGERLFLLLERLCLEPAVYIDVLELIYLCLSLGFMGKYRNLEHGKAQLTQVTDQLYQVIRRQRGAVRKSLLLAAPLQEKHRPEVGTKPLLDKTGLSILIGSLLGALIGFNYFIDHTWLPAYQHLADTLAKT